MTKRNSSVSTIKIQLIYNNHDKKSILFKKKYKMLPQSRSSAEPAIEYW